MKKLLLILLCLPMIGFGQACQYGSSTDASEICDFYKGNNFVTYENADIALEKILAVTGLSKNFALKECSDISNCVATTYKGIRYILFDKEFMDIIATRANSWSNLSILAHEIGHHVNGHTLGKEPTLVQSRQMEIEADEYSGFVMFKLGASLEQAQEVIRLISTNADDSYSTHPSRNKRLKAVERGYTNADVATLTAYDYFSRGGWHSKSEEERIDNYTKCIRLEPDRFGCYYNRAKTYDRLERYEDALADWTKALKITPTDLPYGKSDVLLNRGDVFFKLNKYEEAFNDYNVAMQLNKDYPKGLARAYITRGDAYLNLKKYEKALADYNKAREIINKTGLYPRGFYAPYFLVKLANTKKELMLPYCSDFMRACEIALEGVGLDAAEHKELIGNLPVGCVEYDKSCK